MSESLPFVSTAEEHHVIELSADTHAALAERANQHRRTTNEEAEHIIKGHLQATSVDFA